MSYYAPGASSSTSNVSYAYTALGQRRQVNDSSGTITTYIYDPSGNETSVETNIATSSIANDEIIHYVYDQVTNLLIETWTGAPTVTSDNTAITETKYGYTAQGQLQTVSVVRQNSASVTGSPTTMYSYDANGNVTKISYPNGTETDYDYSQMWNSTGGIEAVSNNRSGTVLSSFVYTFNAQREKVQSQEYMLNVDEASSTNTTITWQYDGDGRLTDETLIDGVAADGYHDRYFYDAAGNRIEEDVTATTSGATTTENYYEYNADGQLTTETDSSATSIVNHYDANGSLIETDSTDVASDTTTTTTYGYDERGRLTSMTKGGVTTQYAYNTNGDRVGEYNSSSSSSYVVDDNNPTGYSQVLETWTGGSTPAVTYEIGATIISQTVSGSGSGAGTQYIMLDGHDSTRQLTSYATSSGTNGLVVARYDYDGFGNSIIIGTSANVASTVIMYTGQMWDPVFGMYDLRARSYNPIVGRFTSRDGVTIAAADTFDSNLYSYVGSSPIGYADPSGHWSAAETVATVGLAIGLIGGTLWFVGAHTNHPFLASVGQNITVVGADIFAAGALFAVSPALGVAAIALEVPLTVWNLYYTWGGNGASKAAQTVTISGTLPAFLNDYSGAGTASSHRVPSIGRVVVRGSSQFGEIPSASEDQRFSSTPVSVHTGDYVYDYLATEPFTNGKVAVQVWHLDPAGNKILDLNTSFRSGTAGQLEYDHALDHEEILGNK